MDNSAVRSPSFWVAIALLITFFLPWLSIIIISFSGFDLAAAPFSAIGAAAGGEVYLALILWLIPIFAVLAIVSVARGTGSGRVSVLIASIVVILTFVIFIIVGSDMASGSGGEGAPAEMQIGTFDVIGIGMWIALVASVIGVLVALGVIKAPRTTSAA